MYRHQSERPADREPEGRWTSRFGQLTMMSQERRKHAATLIIPERFNGPDGSGNGGFTAGLVAKILGGSDVEVRLHQPPPLGRELAVTTEDNGSVAVSDGDQVIATARKA